MKVIVRIRGGLGNQLFCYAAARRLALVNDAELVIDHVSGFARDRLYRRAYMLGNFRIPARLATPAERMEPFERYRRGVAKWLSRRKPFAERRYLEQVGYAFDSRLLDIRVTDTLYLDGLWQSEGYFEDIKDVIRSDLEIVFPDGDSIEDTLSKIRACDSVALHVRWFDDSVLGEADSLSLDYYSDAIRLVRSRIPAPHFFLFSDRPEASRAALPLKDDEVTCVTNAHDEAHKDLWLMSQCKNIITANSTLSWWGAWLGETHSELRVTPQKGNLGKTALWGFEGLIPDRWIAI